MIVGTGVDLVDIDRMRQLVARQGEKLLRRLFAPEELAYCLRHRDPAPSLAARFGAKEAFIKALGGWAEGMRWVEMEVVRDAHGKPDLRLHGAALAALEARGAVAHLSLSHARDQAIAQVILEA